MNSDDVVRTGLRYTLGWVVRNQAKTVGIVLTIKYAPAFARATGWHILSSSGQFLKGQSKITYEHLLKPGAQNVAKRIAARWAAAQAASTVSSGAFAVGVGGAAFSLALMGLVIASGEGQSGIETAEGQSEYEIHAIRIGGGRQVVF